jgi:hypothetical protein
MPQFLCFLEHLIQVVVVSGRRRVRIRDSLQELVEIAAPSLARNVRIVRGGDETDCLRCSCEHIADIVSKTLEYVGRKANFIVNDIVVRWSRGTL